MPTSAHAPRCSLTALERWSEPREWLRWGLGRCSPGVAFMHVITLPATCVSARRSPSMPARRAHHIWQAHSVTSSPSHRLAGKVFTCACRAWLAFRAGCQHHDGLLAVAACEGRRLGQSEGSAVRRPAPPLLGSMQHQQSRSPPRRQRRVPRRPASQARQAAVLETDCWRCGLAGGGLREGRAGLLLLACCLLFCAEAW